MNREEAIRLLRAGDDGIKKWNEFRALEAELPDLSHADLSDTKLQTANLSGVHLEDANLDGALLLNVNLSGAFLCGTQLKGAKIGNTNFSGANCTSADFSDMEAYLIPKGVDFSRANLKDAKLIRCTLHEPNFSGANLSRADLTEADVSRKTRFGAGLQGQNTIEISAANFEGADLSDAVLAGAKLRGARLRHACLRDVSLVECDLDGTDLRQADLSGAGMQGANMKGADLRYANLERADLQRVDFSGANLREIGVGNIWTTLFPYHRMPFILDDCYIKDARFSARASDPWSILRRSYTGPLFLVHLIFLTLFIVPYVGRTVFWVGVNQLEESSVEYTIAAIRHASDKLRASVDPKAMAWAYSADQFVVKSSPENRHKSAKEHAAIATELYLLLTEASELVNSEEFEAKRWGEQAKSLVQIVPASIELRERRVVELLLGWDKGLPYFSLVVALLLYNMGRAWLTYSVVLLREEEDRSAHCPAWKEYQRLHAVHRVVAMLLFIAALSFVFHAWHWLAAPVLLPR